MTDNISRKAAIEAVRAEKVHGDHPTDASYDMAIDHAIAALSALPAVGGCLPCRNCGCEAAPSHSYGIARNGFEVECAKAMETGLGCFSTGLCATEEEAKVVWNTRPTD